MPANARGAPPGRAPRPHQTAAAPAEKQAAAATVPSEPVVLAEAVTELLQRSDEVDVQLRLRLAAFREGYAAAELAHADDYERGFTEGVMALKHTHRDAHKLVKTEAQRWAVRGQPRSRETFGQPHPADYQGGALPLERPGQIFLAGPVVHYHECTAACRSYKPGWYKVPDSQGGAA